MSRGRPTVSDVWVSGKPLRAGTSPRLGFPSSTCGRTTGLGGDGYPCRDVGRVNRRSMCRCTLDHWGRSGNPLSVDVSVPDPRRGTEVGRPGTVEGGVLMLLEVFFRPLRPS